MKIKKNDIDKTLKCSCEAMPSRNGYAYFMPSPNKGKRLLITGWIDPCKAAKITQKIFMGEATVNDFECVEEIDNYFHERSGKNDN